MQKRKVRVTGSVSVTGGSATVETKVTFTPTGTIPIELVALSLRSVTPAFTTFFFVDIPFSIVPGANAEGTVRVDVTGTDERGGTVDVSSGDLTATPTNTLLPAGSCTEDPATLCALNNGRFRVNVDWEDFDGNTGQGMVTSGQRFGDGGWFAFAVLNGLVHPNGFDLFVQMLNRCGNNNHYWVFTTAFTNVEYTLTVTDTETNQERVYDNPLGTVSPAITDTSAFATCP